MKIGKTTVSPDGTTEVEAIELDIEEIPQLKVLIETISAEMRRRT